MISNTAVRAWAWVHKWSSLVCTVFMLLLCLTGLPLIYHHAMPGDTPRANLDKVLDSAKALYPGKIAMYMSQEADEPAIWNVTLGDTPTDEHYKPIAVDARSGEVLVEPKFEGGPFMSTMLRLHVDLFAGLWGKLFLGFMGLLLLVAIVSGVVLYAPFMRRLEFGTVRHGRSARLKWLDLHNLLGIVTLVWAFVVGATGMINTWADVLLKYWQATELAAMVAPYKGQPPPAALSSIHQAIERAEAAEPGMKVGFVAFPGTPFTSSHHYGVFMRGDADFSSRLYTPVLIDAGSGAITDRRSLPWYLSALLISQPLHFGDYGGQPMKLLWALLDLATIVVLVSGLYLWLVRGRAKQARAGPDPVAEVQGGAAPALARGSELL
jgi:uncharacterized iron-regulated membrane protein